MFSLKKTFQIFKQNVHRLRKNDSNIRKYSDLLNSSISMSCEMKEALQLKKPIVALESTIITHGMPYPQNVQTALQVENIVRSQNAIPATIGILNGKIKIGLTHEEIELLGSVPNAQTIKTSRRDLAYVMSCGLNGGTTVSATIICANLVGIDIFATGGIGGVHRNVEDTMDVSADLIELGRSPITVVSSGIKSILDIPKSLEYLETQGVTVATYQSNEKDFPAFYSIKSGSKAPYNLNNSMEAANLILTSKRLNLKSGILIAVPVPKSDALDENRINNVIEEALLKAKAAGISGKEVTPFLLREIGKITKNESLHTNISLIKNNAMVAAKIAVEMSKMRGKMSESSNNENKSLKMKRNSPVVIGGSNVDLCCTVIDNPIKLDGATYRAKYLSFGGGVGRNMAEGISKLNGHVEFISKIGNDKNGDFLLSLFPPDCRYAIEKDQTHHTATCTIIVDDIGDSKLSIANMDIHETINSDMILKYEDVIRKAPLIVFDANLTHDAMSTILEICKKYNKPAFYEPTDINFATKPFDLPDNLFHQIKFITPNIYELNEIGKKIGRETLIENNEIGVDELFTDSNFIKRLANISKHLTKYIDNIIVTLGSNGILITRKFTPNDMKFFNDNHQYIENVNGSEIQHRFYHVEKLTNIVNVSGAGDSFNVGFITAMINGHSENICASVGKECSKSALNSKSAVPSYYFDQNHHSWYQPSLFKTI